MPRTARPAGYALAASSHSAIIAPRTAGRAAAMAAIVGQEVSGRRYFDKPHPHQPAPPMELAYTIATRALKTKLEALRQDDGQATGRLHRELFGDKGLDCRSFEHLLGGLSRAGFVEVRDASFQKDGERIAFQRMSLTEEGHEKSVGALGYVPVQEVAPKVKKRKKAAAAPLPKKEAARGAFFAKKGRRGKKKG